MSFGMFTMPASSGLGGWLVRLALAFFAIAAAWSAYAWYRNRATTAMNGPPPPVPSRFLNTKSGVAYVGSARCGQCHRAEATTYAEHPMGRSTRPANQMLPTQTKAATSFDAAGLHYAIERRGDQVWHREALLREGQGPAVERAAEIAFAIGSGWQGQSFLVNRDGRFFQSPISWYVRGNDWRLSPGYTQNNRHFNRIITESCLFCHCNEAHLKADTINHFELKSPQLEPIGCERCHGPGELHIAAHESGAGEPGADRTIVNPRLLPPKLREAVCEQCHLQGEARVVRPGSSLWSYRPGLPLDQFVSVFVPAPDGRGNRKAVSHVEQMHQSRCYKASGEQLGCISCHDPHVLPAERERVVWYRGRCLSCHHETDCGLPVSKRHERGQEDSCIDCHMPRGDSSNIAHSSITDHRIVRRPSRAVVDDSGSDRHLVRFHAAFWDEGSADRRDLGLALAEVADRADSASQRRMLARSAYTLLTPLLERQPDDVAALEARGQALWWDRQPREALESLEKALKQAPRRELALQTAGLVTLELNETERSISYWNRVLDINPYSWQGHAFRAQALALQKKWGPAIAACEAALRLDPFESRTRMLRIDCLIHQGHHRRARDEFEILLALHVSPPEQLRQWFDELMNSGGKKEK